MLAVAWFLVLMILIISVSDLINDDPFICIVSISFNNVDSHVNVLNLILVVLGGFVANHDGTSVGNKKGGDSHLGKFF